MRARIKNNLGKYATRYILVGLLGLTSFTYFIYDQVVVNRNINTTQQEILNTRGDKVKMLEDFLRSSKLQEEMLKTLCGEECEHLYSKDKSEVK